MSGAGDSKKVIFLALAANLGIAIAKFAAAFFSGSTAMLAEAIHSLVDTVNQVLLLIGQKRAARAPTDEHPLGFGREMFFWAFVVATLLFSLGGVFAIYEGIEKLESHEKLGSPLIGLGVLAISLVLEGISFRGALHEVRKQNQFGSLWQWFRKSTSSELLVLFTEDSAALAGLAIATICLFLAWYTGQPIWDAIGSISVGCILVVVAVLLATEIKSLLIGEAPHTDFRSYIDGRLAELIPGGRVLRLIALQVGAHEVVLSYKIFPGQVTEVKRLIDSMNHLERDVKQRFPEVRWQFVEPDFEA